MTLQPISPFKIFWDWVFDGNLSSPIPKGDNLPDLLHPSSPISVHYILRSLSNHFTVTSYLNKYVNNFGVYYINKEIFYQYVKELIMNFKISRKSIRYFSMYKRDKKLIEAIKYKLSWLKPHEVNLLIDIIDKKENIDMIYSSLGLDLPKKKKFRKSSKKKSKNVGGDIINVKNFIEENFEWI